MFFCLSEELSEFDVYWFVVRFRWSYMFIGLSKELSEFVVYCLE